MTRGAPESSPCLLISKDQWIHRNPTSQSHSALWIRYDVLLEGSTRRFSASLMLWEALLRYPARTDALAMPQMFFKPLLQHEVGVDHLYRVLLSGVDAYATRDSRRCRSNVGGNSLTNVEKQAATAWIRSRISLAYHV